MLTLKQLSVAAGKKLIIDDFSYQFKTGLSYVIMGPNGSGKSTLAAAIMGDPRYQITKGEIYFNRRKITNLSADQRARLGIFLSWQSPVSFSGVSLLQLLQLVLGSKYDQLTIRNQLERLARRVNLHQSYIYRSLNLEASGGEKKKSEVIQALMLNPQLAVFDEIDTGVDIDSLRRIAKLIEEKKGNQTQIIITPYSRILNFLKIDRVLVIVNGRLVAEGDLQLVDKIEKKGYKSLM